MFVGCTMSACGVYGEPPDLSGSIFLLSLLPFESRISLKGIYMLRFIQQPLVKRAGSVEGPPIDLHVDVRLPDLGTR